MLKIFQNLNEFFIKLDDKPISWEKRLVLFVGHMIDKKRQLSTTKSYCSVRISLESQERRKIAIAWEKSLYSVKHLMIWHRDVSS